MGGLIGRKMIGEELVGFQHGLRIEGLVEFLFRHQLVLQYKVVDRAARGVGLLGDLRTVLVSDIRIQGRDDSDRIFHHLVATFLVDRDA